MSFVDRVFYSKSVGVAVGLLLVISLCCRAAYVNMIAENEAKLKAVADAEVTADEELQDRKSAFMKELREKEDDRFRSYRGEFQCEIDLLEKYQRGISYLEDLQHGRATEKLPELSIRAIGGKAFVEIGTGAFCGFALDGADNGHVKMRFENTMHKSVRPVVEIRFYGPLLEYVGSVSESWRFGSIDENEAVNVDHWISPGPTSVSRPTYFSVRYRERTSMFGD